MVIELKLLSAFLLVIPILLAILLIVYLLFAVHEQKVLSRILEKELIIRDNIVVLKKFKPFFRYILIDVLTFIGSSYLALLIFTYSIFFIGYFLATTVLQLVIFIGFSYIVLIYTHKFNVTELLVYRKKIGHIGIIIFITYVIVYMFLSVYALFS
jgi:hypothetical protein